MFVLDSIISVNSLISKSLGSCCLVTVKPEALTDFLVAQGGSNSQVKC